MARILIVEDEPDIVLSLKKTCAAKATKRLWQLMEDAVCNWVRKAHGM